MNEPLRLRKGERYEDCEDNMDKYVCPCGYVYDPAVGDPEHGIAPGTPWEKVPDSWECPICGMGKEVFEKE